MDANRIAASANVVASKLAHAGSLRMRLGSKSRNGPYLRRSVDCRVFVNARNETLIFVWSEALNNHLMRRYDERAKCHICVRVYG